MTCFQLTRLPWDSEHFGFPVGSLAVAAAGLDLEASVRKARAEGLRLLYIKTDGADLRLMARIRATGARDCGANRTYRTSPCALATALPDRVRRFAESEPTAAMVDLAVRAGHLSRFNLDPDFPGDKFRLLYTLWLTQACTRLPGRNVVVTGSDAVTGLATVTTGHAEAVIGLVAVAEAATGRGLAGDLVRACAALACRAGAATLTVATQAANGPACRVYEREGFQAVEETRIHHLWL